jgi:hypothetical protein
MSLSSCYSGKNNRVRHTLLVQFELALGTFRSQLVVHALRLKAHNWHVNRPEMDGTRQHLVYNGGGVCMEQLTNQLQYVFRQLQKQQVVPTDDWDNAKSLSTINQYIHDIDQHVSLQQELFDSCLPFIEYNPSLWLNIYSSGYSDHCGHIWDVVCSWQFTVQDVLMRDCCFPKELSDIVINEYL